MRLIDADALLEAIKKEDKEYPELSIYWSRGSISRIIKRLPTVDAVPVAHGRWIKDGDFLICLNCEGEINVKNSLGVENHKNYCPNCGAKMDGDAT